MKDLRYDVNRDVSETRYGREHRDRDRSLGMSVTILPRFGHSQKSFQRFGDVQAEASDYSHERCCF